MIDKRKATAELERLTKQLRFVANTSLNIPIHPDVQGDDPEAATSGVVIAKAIHLLAYQHRLLYSGPRFTKLVATRHNDRPALYAMDVIGRVYVYDDSLVEDEAYEAGWQRLQGDDNRDPRAR
jgi:hypothetical protein